VTDRPEPRTDEDRPSSARRPWLLVGVAVLLVAGAAFAAGRFSAFGALSGGPNAADVGFARDMQLHHSQAVEMAMTEYRGTDDDELRTIAYDIATAQAGQSGEMYGWLVAWGVPQASDEPLMAWMTAGGHDHGGGGGEDATDAELRAAMGMASDEELARLREADGVERDCLFASLMIRHHGGAIEMIDAVRELGNDARVSQAADGMADSQQREIEALQSVQRRLGCSG